MIALPLPCPLNPEAADAQHVCAMYGLTPKDWNQLCQDEWRHVRAVVKSEYLTHEKMPQSFHLLPFFRAHALHSPSATRRQAANWMRADTMEPYFSNDA